MQKLFGQCLVDKILPNKKTTYCLFVLVFFCAFIFLLRWSKINSYPLFEDEILSIDVMDSIARTGFPYRHDEFIYWRALVAQYLMAIPLFFSDISVYSTRFMSILFSVLVLPFVFFMGKRSGGWFSGVLACFFIGFSAYENFISEMARFYIVFQFFFIAAIYFANDYFINRNRQAGIWLLLATIGAIGSHELSLQLFFIFPLGVFIGRRWDLFRAPRFLMASICVFVLSYLFIFWTPPGSYRSATSMDLTIGALSDKLFFFKAFGNIVPFGLEFLALGFAAIFFYNNKTFKFYYSSFVLMTILLSMVAPNGTPRYFSNLFPLGVVVICSCAVFWVKKIFENSELLLKQKSVEKNLLVAFLLSFFIVSCFGSWSFSGAKKSFGFWLKSENQKYVHSILKNNISSGDIVISMEPELTEFYLDKKTDYFVREKYVEKDNNFRKFKKSEKKYFPFELIDSPEKFKKIINTSNPRVWIYATWKGPYTLSEETIKIMEKKFRVVAKKEKNFLLLKN